MSALASMRPDDLPRPTLLVPASGVYAPLSLRDDPFPQNPLAGAWVNLPSQQASLEPIRFFMEGDAPGLVIVGGGEGTGKTRLLHHLATLRQDRLTGIVQDDGARRSDAHLLRTTIVALGGRPIGRAGLELAMEARALLDARRGDARMPVLFIDQAALAGSQLEIVRSLLVSPNGETRVQIALFGPPELEDRIARRRSLSRFLQASVTLKPLDRDEARLLIDERIAAVRHGNHGDIFTPIAMEALWQATGGTPGAMMHLAHRCLREAIATGETRIDAGLVTRIAESPVVEVTRAAAPEEPIQTRLTLPGMDETAAPSRRRGRQR